MLEKKGKNFSANNSSGKRKDSDFYETPFSLTQLLLDKLDLEELKNKTILEPCFGKGAILDVLGRNGFDKDKVYCYDINASYLPEKKDFLEEIGHYDVILTNPPFSKAFEFIKKAKEVSDSFFFLLPLSYLHGKKRYDEIYSDRGFPLKKVFIFTRYPMLGERLREDGKFHTGMMVYAWFWWEKNYLGESTIDWLDNNEFVLRKGRVK